MENLKKCFGCDQLKTRDQFNKHSKKKDGLQSRCKNCQQLASVRYKAALAETFDETRIPAEKTCPCCGLTKGKAEFGIDRKDARGLQSRCRACQRDFYLADYDKHKDRARIYYSKNSEEIRLKVRANYRKDKEEGRPHKQPRNNRLRYLYGINEKDYEYLLKKQSGKCAICGILPEKASRGVLFVDHDHETGNVRGLLCGSCNKMLGDSRDNPETLRSGALYIEKYLLNPTGAIYGNSTI